jgi:hypothetical protein
VNSDSSSCYLWRDGGAIAIGPAGGRQFSEANGRDRDATNLRSRCKLEARVLLSVRHDAKNSARVPAWTAFVQAVRNGEVGIQRLVATARRLWNWAIADGFSDGTPFKRSGVSVLRASVAAWVGPRQRAT